MLVPVSCSHTAAAGAQLLVWTAACFLLSTVVINQYFSFFPPKFFISEYVTKPLSGNVLSMSVFVWRVYRSSAFIYRNVFSEMPVSVYKALQAPV